MENTAAAAATLSIPEDIIVEILMRVKDVSTLFRCATTCKRWGGLIADPSFLRRSSRLLGFFAMELRRGEPDLAPVPAFFPSHSPRLPLDHDDHGRLFAPGNPGGLLNCPKPLASRGGLLLVRFGFRLAGHVRLAVCDPLVGTCDLLPPLRCNGPHCYSLLTVADCYSDDIRRPLPGYSALFKVLVVSNYGDLYTFSSAEPGWSESASCFDRANLRWLQSPSYAVVCPGTARWLFTSSTANLYVLGVGIESGQVSIKKLSRNLDAYDLFYDTPRLIVGGGEDDTLSLLRLHYYALRLEIWTCRQGDGEIGGEEWLLTRVVELKRPSQKSIRGAACVCVAERSGAMLIDEDRRLYSADLETGAMEEVTGHFGD